MEVIEYSFFMPLEHVPTATAQTARIISRYGKFRKYDDPGLSLARRILTAGLFAFVPDKPVRGPVELFTEWRFDYKSHHKDGEYKTTKPDTDNLNKMLKDIMTNLGYWEDDKQVVVEHIKKVWDKTNPGIWIKMRTLERFERYERGNKCE